MATPTKIAAARASERLTQSLINLAARGLRTHCQDPELGHLWLSDHEPERAVASVLCGGCPLALECWDAARSRDERFGVWGGVDMTKHPNGQGAKIGRPKKIAPPP
jgi:Transcription factor WhiB